MKMESETISLLAKSSIGKPYTVSFVYDKGKISGSCNCQAGLYGKLCKHLIGLASGDDSLLYDVSQRSEFETVLEVVESTELQHTLSIYNKAKKEMEEAKEKVNRTKSIIANTLKA